MKGNLYVTGDIKINNGIEVDGYIHAGRDIQVSGSCKVKGNLYAGRDITLYNGAEVDGYVIAKKKVSIHGIGLKSSSDASVFVYSAEGDIELPSGADVKNGIVYAPNGAVKLASSVTFYGSIVGRRVTGMWEDKVALSKLVLGAMSDPDKEFPFMGGSGGEPKWKFVHYE